MAHQKRIVGLCLILAWRTDDEAARKAIAATHGVIPDKVWACVDHYGRQNGWTPPG